MIRREQTRPGRDCYQPHALKPHLWRGKSRGAHLKILPAWFSKTSYATPVTSVQTLKRSAAVKSPSSWSFDNAPDAGSRILLGNCPFSAVCDVHTIVGYQRPWAGSFTRTGNLAGEMLIGSPLRSKRDGLLAERKISFGYGAGWRRKSPAP